MRAQINQAFIYITAIVVIGMIFLISFTAIQKIFETSSEAGIEQFSSKLVSQVNKHSRVFGAKSQYSFNIPNDIEKIYFLDTEVLRLKACDIEDSFRVPIVIKTLAEEECSLRLENKHTMFVLGEDFFYKYKAGSIYLNGELVLDLPVDNQINLLFEGRGGKALLQTLDSFLISLDLPAGETVKEYILESIGKDAKAIIQKGVNVAYPIAVENQISMDKRNSKTSFSREMRDGVRSGIIYKSDIYDFKPSEIYFSKPITIELSYDLDIKDISELQQLKAYELNVTDWLEIKNPILDITKKTVSFEVDHFGTFVIAKTIDCKIQGNCPSCEQSACGGDIGGIGTQCCPVGLGYGKHFEVYDDLNYACWSECAQQISNLAND